MFKTLLIKDLRIYFSDKRGIIFTFLLPILLISLFTFAFGGTGKKKSGPSSLAVLIADEDNSQASKEFVKTLEFIPVIKLTSIEKSKADEQILKGQSAGVLVIQKGFGNSLLSDSIALEFRYDAAKTIEVSMLKSILHKVTSDQVKTNRLKYSTPQLLQEQIPSINQSTKSVVLNEIQKDFISTNPQIKMNSIVKPATREVNLGLIQAVAGTSIMMLLFSIAAIGAGILDEKESGTIKRLLTAPVKISHILMAKMTSGFIIGIAQLIVLLIFAWLAFGLPLFSNLPALVLLVICIAFAVASFGILLAAIAKSRQQLQGMSTIIILFMSAIGGSMVPLFAMPVFMKKIAVFSVNYWGIQGFFDIFWRDLPTLQILPRLGILLAIGLVITFISIKFLSKSIVKFA